MDGKTNKPIPLCQNVTKAEHVRKALYAKIRVANEDLQLYAKFHTTTKGKVCFEDGVLDFKTKKFTFWEDMPNDTIYSTKKISRKFAKVEKNEDGNAVLDENGKRKVLGPDETIIATIEKIKQVVFEPNVWRRQNAKYVALLVTCISGTCGR
jgi:hypothetical protein